MEVFLAYFPHCMSNFTFNLLCTLWNIICFTSSLAEYFKPFFLRSGKFTLYFPQWGKFKLYCPHCGKLTKYFLHCWFHQCFFHILLCMWILYLTYFAHCGTWNISPRVLWKILNHSFCIVESLHYNFHNVENSNWTYHIVENITRCFPHCGNYQCFFHKIFFTFHLWQST